MSIGCKSWISLVKTQLVESKNALPSWVKKNQTNLKYLNYFILACNVLMSFSWMLIFVNLESIKEKLICWPDNMPAVCLKSQSSFHTEWSVVWLKDNKKCQRVTQTQLFLCKIQPKTLKRRLRKLFARKKSLKVTQLWIIVKISFLVAEIRLISSESQNMEETGNFIVIFRTYNSYEELTK